MQLSLGQRANQLTLTALIYSAWRARSLSWLTGESFPLSREIALLQHFAQVKPADYWLDIGCSTGVYSLALAEKGAQVCALDLSIPMLLQAERQRPHPNISYQQGIFEEVHWDAPFAGIAVGATLNEFRDINAALHHMCRYLAEGGTLFLMYVAQAVTPEGRWLQKLLELSGIHFPAEKNVNTYLESWGLELIHTERHRAVCFAVFKQPTSSHQRRRERYAQSGIPVPSWLEQSNISNP